MIIPAKDTQQRLILDALHANPQGLKQEETKRSFSSLSGAVISRMLQSGRNTGLIHVKDDRYMLTTTSKDLYRDEDAVKVNPMDSFKPLDPSRWLSTKGTRDQSDWSRDVYPSVNATLGGGL